MACRSGASTASAIVGELLGGRPSGVDVAGGEHDLDERREHRRARELPAALLDHAADGGDGGVHLPSASRRSANAGRRLAAVLAGRAVRPLGVGQLAAQPMELALLVEGEPERGMGGLGQPLPGPLHLRDRLRPLAVRLQDLRPVHEALAPVRHEIGLRGAPMVERLGPLGRPPQVEHVHARLDDGAVDDPRRDRRHLAGGHGHHHLVEQAHARGGVAQRERRLAAAEHPEREEILVVESLGDGDDLVGELVGRGASPLPSVSRNTRNLEIAARGAVARRPRRGAARHERTSRPPGPCRRGA